MSDSSSDTEGSSTASSSSSIAARKKTRLSTEIRTSCTGRYRTSWTLPKYITSSSRNGKSVHCKLCCSELSVAHGGINDVNDILITLKHKAKLKETERCSSLPSLFDAAQQPTLAHYKKVISAEMMMAQFITMHNLSNLSFQASDHLSDLFWCMFPDSSIAKDFACKHTKTKAIICDALDPHLKKPVIDVAKKFPFNLLCDESNDKCDKVKLLTILIRVFEPDNSIMVTRHLDTIGIVDLTAEGIFSGIKSTFDKYDLSFSNLLSFTSDTCNTMKGARGGVISKLRSEQRNIIDVHCVCHLLSLCVKAATKTMSLKIDELLVDIYYHFHHSVKRITSLYDYAEFCSVEFKSILKHCETRWLSLGRAIQRTLEMWDPLCSYFRSHPDVEKQGKVRSILKQLNDPLTKLWFCFLSNILPIFDSFNISFQTSSTATVHKLHGETERLLKKVLSFFIRPGEIRLRADDLTQLDYAEAANHLSKEDLFIGDNTVALVIHQRDEGEAVNRFYTGIKNFYVAFVKKLLKVFDFKSQVLRSLAFLDPTVSQQASQSIFDVIEDIIPIAFDKSLVKLEYREFVIDGEVDPSSETDAVKFWISIRNMKSPMGAYLYHNLATLTLQLLAIPVSNADCERVFSLVRRIKTDYRSSLLTETLSALIGCHFNKTVVCCELTKFEESLLTKAKSCTMERNLSYKNN